MVTNITGSTPYLDMNPCCGNEIATPVSDT